jgi:hypothetical protein
MQNTPHQQHNTNQATQQTKPHNKPTTPNTNQATQHKPNQ